MKNFLLKTIAYLAAFIFIVSASCLDSMSWVPAIVCVASLGYLLLFALANKEWLSVYEDSRWEK